MQIRFPRRIQLGFRPWYGLTLRQLLYLVAAATCGLGVILIVRGEFVVRVLIGLAIIAVGVALAFFRKDGLSIEQWIATRVKFGLRPQRRVWSRGDSPARHHQVAEIELDDAPADASADPAAVSPAPPSASDTADAPAYGERTRLLRPTPRAETPAHTGAIVFIDLAMLAALSALAVYLFNGGWGDVQGWFAVQFGP